MLFRSNLNLLKQALWYYFRFFLITGIIVSTFFYFYLVSNQYAWGCPETIAVFGWFVFLTVRPAIILLDIYIGEKIVYEGNLSYHKVGGGTEGTSPYIMINNSIMIKAANFNSKHEWQKHIIEGQVQIIHYTVYSKIILQIDNFEL